MGRLTEVGQKLRNGRQSTPSRGDDFARLCQLNHNGRFSLEKATSFLDCIASNAALEAKIGQLFLEVAAAREVKVGDFAAENDLVVAHR